MTARVVGRGAVLACVLLASASPAVAVNPALDVSQYAHTAWKIRDGFSQGFITVIAQTPDGYLWLGTEFGLLRFDGVRNVQWQPPAGESLPDSYIRSLLSARDGTLWIGTVKGLASWKNGKLTQYPELAAQDVVSLIEARDGSVWAGGQVIPTGRLCTIHGDRVHCYGDDGSLGRWVLSLHEDSSGNLWVAAENGLWHWTPGPAKRYSLSASVTGTFDAIAEDGAGAILIATDGGIRQLKDGHDEAFPLPNTRSPIRASALLRDRDGGLWIGSSEGLLHVHQGRTDLFARSDGLSADRPTRLFEDREGNIWVATQDGLDRFREYAAATLSVSQGLPSGVVGAVLAARDGSAWLDSAGSLSRLNDGQVTVYGGQRGIQSLFQDHRGRLWISTSGGLGYLENDRFISVDGVPGGYLNSIAEDSRGNLWIANQALGLFRLFGSNQIQQIPWATLGRKDPAFRVAADPVRGGLWLGFQLGGVAYYVDERIRATYAPSDGLGKGRVNYLRVDPDGALWAATEGGLSRLKNGRVATLRAENGLPCDSVDWMIEDDVDSVWLYMACGLVRIARSELESWTAAVEHHKGAKPTIQATFFDSSDGIRSVAILGSSSPHAAKSPDGKLWFATLDGVTVLDPRHLPFNHLPPPVHIEQITADRKTYDASSQPRLPSLIRDVQIDYTALSLVAPEKNRFKVKLEGWDREWQDVGNRRQAFYNNLPPRKYRFRVLASNNSGVWNEAGASLDFAIAPAYYQTTWFQAVIAMAGLTLLWAAYRFRVRRIAYEFDLRLDERVNERTRVARELHDTLLQTFHGVLFRFQAAVNMLPERPAEAKQKLDGAIDRAAQAITEGRDAIQDLRTSTVVTNDLALAITTLGDELAASGVNGNGTVVDVAVQGTPQDLHPILRDDIYRIAGEALRNAFRHAHARRIEVEIRYDDRRFQLRVRDDGKGIDTAVMGAEHPGHFGLPGMRERAELVGGHLDVWSEAGLGTEIDLTIPAVKAYAAARARRRARWFEK